MYVVFVVLLLTFREVSLLVCCAESHPAIISIPCGQVTACVTALTVHIVLASMRMLHCWIHVVRTGVHSTLTV